MGELPALLVVLPQRLQGADVLAECPACMAIPTFLGIKKSALDVNIDLL